LFIYIKKEKMAEKGSNNWLWWSIGGIATLGLGLGIYYFVKADKEAKAEEEKNKQGGGSLPNYTPPVTTNTNTTSAPSPSPAPAPAPSYTPLPTPFTSVEQSNAFRKWVNDKDPAFAKEIGLEMNLSNPNTRNNETIQKAWGKYSDLYYTENASNLGFAMRIATGATQINGGVIWKSSDAIPRGEVTMYTDGKITANAINTQGAQTKFIQGGWYKSGNTYNLMIGGANYSSGVFGLRNDFWNILKKAGIFNDSNNSYSAFNANLGTTKFGLSTDGTRIQDEML